MPEVPGNTVCKFNDDMEMSKTTRLQHDNDPCHKVRGVIQCFARMGLRFLSGSILNITTVRQLEGIFFQRINTTKNSHDFLLKFLN